MAGRGVNENVRQDDDGEHGDSGIDENTTDEQECHPQPESSSRKSVKDRFHEKSDHYQKLIEQASRYRRKGSTPRSKEDQGSIRVDAGSLKPGPRVPPRPLNRDRTGETDKRREADDVKAPRITVMVKDKGQTKGQTRTHLPSVRPSEAATELPSYTKNDLPTHSKSGPSYSKKTGDGRRASRGLESKSLPNTPRDPGREPLSARGTNINKISMDDATRSLISPRKARPAKLSPLKH